MDSRDSLYTYNVSAVPQPSFIADLDENLVQLKVLYNMIYNVSVVRASPCGQRINVTTFDQLHYGECHACT